MGSKIELDDIDRRILVIVQRDATTPIQEIADRVGLTSNPCWRRLKRLEHEGIITRRVAVVDPVKLGLGTTTFVTVRTDSHTSEWLQMFKRAVDLVPEIIECYRMTGDVDYLLKIVVRDLAHYDDVYRTLLDKVPDLSDVSSTFAMETLKSGAVIEAF